MTVALFALAAVTAVGDWVAVHRRRARLERVLKPLALALLLAAATTADLGPAQTWVVAALAFGLAGDVALMLSRPGPPDTFFLAGLGAFLVGHVLYLVGFAHLPLTGLDVVAGLFAVIGVAGLFLVPVLRGAGASGGRVLAVAVGLYAATLAAMAVMAIATALLLTAVGGVLFLVSDTVLGRERFVGTTRHGELAVIVTYHLAQGLIVLGLVR